MEMIATNNRRAIGLFAIMDICGSDIGGNIATRAVDSLRTMGLSPIVITSSKTTMNKYRKLSAVMDKSDMLTEAALAGYVSLNGRNIVEMDTNFDDSCASVFSKTYDLILFLLEGSSLNWKINLRNFLPLLAVIDIGAKNAFSSSKAAIDGMLECPNAPRPIAFVISSLNRVVESRISRRIGLQSWGQASNIEHIVEKMLQRMNRFSPDAQKDEAHNEHIGKIAEDVISSLRKNAFGSQNASENSNIRAVMRREVRKKIDNLDCETELLKRVADATVGLGPIDSLIRDTSITEIMANGPNDIYIEKNGSIEKTDVHFKNEERLLSIIERMVAKVNRRVDELSPMVDARMPDGSRINAIIKPLAVNGPFLTIRRFSPSLHSMDDIISSGTISRRFADFLMNCVRNRASIIISGGTGSGKTTMLGLLASAISGNERIITIEDAAELSLAAEHVVKLEARPPNIEGSGEISIRDLVKNALRMRPDRIIVGECRGAEALDMLQAMNTGHAGSMTSVHANSPRDAISRLETMVLMANAGIPLDAIRGQIARAVNIIVHLARMNGQRHVVEIAEVTGMEGNIISMQTIAFWNVDKSLLEGTGMRPHFFEVNSEADMATANW